MPHSRLLHNSIGSNVPPNGFRIRHIILSVSYTSVKITHPVLTVKRAIFTAALALASSSATEAATVDNLLYYYDFNDLTGHAATAPNLSADKGGTAAKGSLASLSWANYTDANLSYEGAHAYRAQGNSNNDLQLNFGSGEFSGGFTMSVMVRDFASWGNPATTSSSAQYGRILGLTDSSRIYYMQKANGNAQSSGAWEQFCSDGNTLASGQAGAPNNLGNWASGIIERDSYTNITVTMAASETDPSLTTVTVYFDGQKKMAANTTLDLANLANLQFAKANGIGSFDNLQIYDTALSAAEVSYLASHPASVIPEPATATLSAMALLAMASRRRKKML